MRIMSPSFSAMSNGQQEEENFDELAMQESLLFSDSLKDLKNLRSQLYSAAEYFEISYNTDDHKQFMVSTLKDYAIKALVNTVDHLGSISFKVNGFLDDKVDEVSGVEFRVSCIEQRIQTCQELVDHEGLCQQSLVIKAPKYHKRYTLTVGESMSNCGNHAIPNNQESRTKKYNKPTELRPVRPTIKYEPPSLRKARSISRTPSSRARSVSPRKMRSPSPSTRSGKYSNAEKRGVPPLQVQNRLARSGSLAVRPTLLNSTSSIRWQYPSSPQKSASMRLHNAERNYHKDNEQNHGKGKNLLKSLLNRLKSKKDNVLYEYLNEY